MVLSQNFSTGRALKGKLGIKVTLEEQSKGTPRALEQLGTQRALKALRYLGTWALRRSRNLGI